MPSDYPQAELESTPEFFDFGPHDLAVLDLDRALIYSDNLSGVVYDGLRRLYSTDPEKVALIDKVQHREVLEKGNSFPYVEMLETEIGQEFDPKVLARQVIEANRDPQTGRISDELINTLMIEGSIEYIKRVAEADAHLMIMTAGQEKTQLMKIEIINAILAQEVGRPIDAFLVVDDKHPITKWHMLAGVYDPQTGQFNVGRLRQFTTPTSARLDGLEGSVVRRITLTDDKKKNLQPDDSTETGYPIRSILVKKDNDPNADGIAMADVASRVELAA